MGLALLISVLVVLSMVFPVAYSEMVGTPPDTVSIDDAAFQSPEYVQSLRLKPKQSVADLKEKKRAPAAEKKLPSSSKRPRR